MAASINRPIDLLVLPELAISGYSFKSPSEIRPYLETQSGPSFRLAKELSSLYSCTTVIGYPEDYEGTTYNSALVVNEEGQLVYNYRKTHLYETDEAWGCSENPDKSFGAVDLALGKGASRQIIRTSLGICMDLNPYKFTAPFNEFEYALSAYANGSELLVVPTAWLNSGSPDIQNDLSKEEKESKAAKIKAQFESSSYPGASDTDMLLIDYWILRLFPFLAHPSNGMPRPHNKITAVLCNRTGIENQTLYGGSSCIMQFDRSVPDSDELDSLNPSVKVLASAGSATEECVYHEVEI